MKHDIMVKYMIVIINVVADALSRRPMSYPTCAATSLVCDISSLLSKLQSSRMLDTHAAAILEKLNANRHVKHHCVKPNLLWFLTKREIRRMYVPA